VVTVVTGRCTGHDHGLTGRVRSALTAVRRAGARVCNRRVRSLTELEHPVRHPEGRAGHRADRTRDASGHVRSDAFGRGGSSLDSDRTPSEARPVKR
jgi:hypothetical protein